VGPATRLSPTAYLDLGTFTNPGLAEAPRDRSLSAHDPCVDAADNWRIGVHDKEMLEYWEGDAGYVFDCAWGATPPKLFVPPASIWDESVPSWMRGRREIVLERLRDQSGHDVLDDDRSYRDWAIRVLPPHGRGRAYREWTTPVDLPGRE
jgi:hypothetical protein